MKKAKKKEAAPAEPVLEAKEQSIWELTATGQKKYAEVPKRERDRWLKIAVEATNHNNLLVRAVWAGKKPKTALAFEDEGGELKRVGWPEGYRPELDPQRTRGGSAPAAKARAERAPVPASLTGVVKLLVKENPKKAGSGGAARFALYRDGMRVEEYVAAGGTVADVKWDVGRGFIALV